MANKDVRILWYGDAVIKKLNSRIGANIEKAAIHFQNALKETLSKPGTGKRYRRRGKPGDKRKVGSYHVASRPGQPPAVDMGNLRRSIFMKYRKSTYSARIGVRSVYARRLEFGGAHTTKNGKVITVAARPYLHPTFRRERKAMIRIIAGK